MLRDILIYLLIAVVLFLGGFAFYFKYQVNGLEVDVENKRQAIKAYEDILVVVPFTAMNKERNSNAKKEIQKTLDSGRINDGLYSGL